MRLLRAGAAIAVVAAVAALAACGGDDDDGGGDGGGGSPRPLLNQDHWHAAFGVYVCDAFLPDLPQFESPDGIHTHGDGVIHIHPFSAAAAGENATLDVFLDAAGVEVGDDELTVEGETYAEGDDSCPDGDGQVRVLRWSYAGDSSAEPEDVAADVRFAGDGEGYVVAFVAEGTEVPEPESADQLAELGAFDMAPTTSSDTALEDEPADDADGAEPATSTDDRTLADGFYPVEIAEPVPCRSPGMRPGRDGVECYRLPDEPALGADAVEDAEAAPDPINGDWRVDLVFTEDGIAAFNDVAATCVQQGATCPLGRLALVVDGEVLMAPTIAEPSYERDQIIVAGNFTRDEAESIADNLEV